MNESSLKASDSHTRKVLRIFQTVQRLRPTRFCASTAYHSSQYFKKLLVDTLEGLSISASGRSPDKLSFITERFMLVE